MPNTAVFLPAIIIPPLGMGGSYVVTLFLRSDFEIVRDFAGARDGGSSSLSTALLVFGPHGPLQCDLPVLHHDLDVVRVGRERFVVDQSLADLSSQIAIVGRILLLISRRL